VQQLQRHVPSAHLAVPGGNNWRDTKWDCCNWTDNIRVMEIVQYSKEKVSRLGRSSFFAMHFSDAGG
jgi:hypothetical protein